jgi:hypothetical protein
MGASLSKTEPELDSELNVSEKLDYVATYYILTSDFKSLKNLYKKEYCDDLVILTSDIIQKHLNYQEIAYLQYRVINGETENEMKEEPLLYLSKSMIEKDVGKNISNEKNKSRMCIGIAKFYIKIAHIFAAIITSVNPMYSYNVNGEEKQVDKNDIPNGVKVKVNIESLCQRRLTALKDGHDYINAKEIEVSPNLCAFKSKESLIEEPGIPELEELYYDKYDFEEGKFYGMTEKSRKLYENDVRAFYEIFMNKDVPDTIKKFSDIKLRDYENSQECQGNAIFKRTFKGPKEALFAD